jgi:hypothetical protein
LTGLPQSDAVFDAVLRGVFYSVHTSAELCG